MTLIGIINGDMLNARTDPGECDWATPDYFTPADLEYVTDMDPATYAASYPHMIVWVQS